MLRKNFSLHHYECYDTTTIGNDVWIGMNVFIKAGVKIGDGAVIGACSVVTKDVAPYAIVGGNPAVVIRYRFDESTIQSLLDIGWWNLSDDEVADLSPMFQSPHDVITRLTHPTENGETCPAGNHE